MENSEKRSLLRDTELQTDADGENSQACIEKQMREISHIFHYWGTKCAEFREYAKQTQTDFDIWLANKKQEALTEKAKIMDPKEASRFKRDISESAKKELVITTFEKEYREKLYLIYENERKVEELEKALKAIEMKSFNLGSFASTMRKEYGTVK
jgi:hypothetical protein